jgi:hypothetical protein
MHIYEGKYVDQVPCSYNLQAACYYRLTIDSIRTNKCNEVYDVLIGELETRPKILELSSRLADLMILRALNGSAPLTWGA